MNKQSVQTNNIFKESQYKQGRARKVSPHNFYLICEYLNSKSHEKNSMFNSEKRDEFHSELLSFLTLAPAEHSSQAYIEEKNLSIEKRIKVLENRIKTGVYPTSFENKDRSEKEIEDCKRNLVHFQSRFEELTDKMIYELHILLTKLRTSFYESMISWIKQKRYRRTKETHQVTLNKEGKNALDSLKNKLGTKDFNATLRKLDSLHK